ncbi:MAG TPA: molybdopterin molybdotransferase MoeA [Naasia sp.]
MSLDWRAARELAHATGDALRQPAVRRPLAEAAGLTLAEPLRAAADLPAFDRSAMDGWVVAGPPPWRLLEGIPIGSSPIDTELASGEARPVVTGAPVPAGMVAVLRREHGRVDGDLLHPLPARTPEPGEDIRLTGEEARRGELLLPAGSVLTPAALSLAAVAGADDVAVAGPPVVDLLLLGDEVVPAGIPPLGRVRDAYGPAFPPLLASLGGRAGTVTRGPDRLDATVDRIAASTAPILVTTGGTAAGEGDQMRAALDVVGCALVLDGVAMRPGSPTLLARRTDGRPVLALPGNPFAALVALHLLGAPLLDGLLGRPLRAPAALPAARAVENPRTTALVLACRLTPDGLAPTGWQGSAMLRGLAEAQFLALIPPGGVDAGASVPVLHLPV